jgi:hypothetical protein
MSGVIILLYILLYMSLGSGHLIAEKEKESRLNRPDYIFRTVLLLYMYTIQFLINSQIFPFWRHSHHGLLVKLDQHNGGIRLTEDYSDDAMWG